MAPQNHAAWLPEAKGRLQVKEAPYHPPGAAEVVIKNRAVAINPVDWKQQDYGMFIEKYPTISGCDIAGVVEEVGSEVTSFKKGDRVMSNSSGLSLGGQTYGGFQSFVLCPANVVCKIPESMSFEQASVLPLAVNTAAEGLFGPDHLNLPRPPVTQKADGAVFIYAGSTSVGSAAIQLAKAAGLLVVTTSSKHNFDFCKKLGADHVFDYKDANWASQVADLLKGKKVVGGYDSISEESTVRASADLLQKTNSDAAVMTVLPPPEGLNAKGTFGAGVTLKGDLARWIWTDFLPLALEKGLIQPKPDPVIAGKGLGDIQKGLDMQRSGVSAQKVVVSLE